MRVFRMNLSCGRAARTTTASLARVQPGNDATGCLRRCRILIGMRSIIRTRTDASRSRPMTWQRHLRTDGNNYQEPKQRKCCRRLRERGGQPVITLLERMDTLWDTRTIRGQTVNTDCPSVRFPRGVNGRRELSILRQKSY